MSYHFIRLQPRYIQCFSRDKRLILSVLGLIRHLFEVIQNINVSSSQRLLPPAVLVLLQASSPEITDPRAAVCDNIYSYEWVGVFFFFFRSALEVSRGRPQRDPSGIFRCNRSPTSCLTRRRRLHCQSGSAHARHFLPQRMPSLTRPRLLPAH